MKFLILVFFSTLTICISSCVATKNKNYTFNQKYSAAQIKEDIAVMKRVLEANHPSLYWYTPKDSIDYYFENIAASITDSLTELQAKNKLASIVSKIKCGHTSVLYSKQFIALADKHKYPQFPLSIKVWKDTFFVMGYYNKEDSALKPGTFITSINGKSNQQVIDSVFNLISTDGNANNYKYVSLSTNFPAWYKNAFGLDSIYKIGYLDSNKNTKFTTIKWHNPKPNTTKKLKDTAMHKTTVTLAIKDSLSKRQRKLLSFRSMTIDTNLSTAFIRLKTFSNGNLKCFFNKSFKEIENKKIKNIVFDIRENGGGSVNKTVHLLQYLKDSSFKIGDTVMALHKSINEKKYIKNWFTTWLAKVFTSFENADGLQHNKRFEEHYFKPFQNHHFNGNIYIIQGGLSFSAATIFSSFLKNQSNVTIVGEESGGGYYGNSAMIIPFMYLPNTKLRVRLPLYKYVMDKTRAKGQGVAPDILIEPNSAALKNGIDLKLEKIKELIKEKNKN